MLFVMEFVISFLATLNDNPWRFFLYGIAAEVKARGRGSTGPDFAGRRFFIG